MQIYYVNSIYYYILFIYINNYKKNFYNKMGQLLKLSSLFTTYIIVLFSFIFVKYSLFIIIYFIIIIIINFFLFIHLILLLLLLLIIINIF